MTAERPEHRVVVSGVGLSAVGRRVGRSPFQLTIDAIGAAVADAGLQSGDIDGLATFPGLAPELVPGFVGPDLYDVADALGVRLDWHLGAAYGAGPLGPLLHGVLAVAAGLCRHAVVFRTISESSAQTTARREGIASGLEEAAGPWSWLLSVGALSAANWAGLYAQRHMHRYGTTREQLGWVAVTERRHAARHPGAVWRTALSMDEYLAARMVSSPLGLYDCDTPVDGSAVIVISHADTVADLRHPVRVESLGGAIRHRPLWEQWDDLTTMAAHDVAAQLWSRTDLKPADVDVAQLYDGFSIFVLLWLEALGFCPPGAGGPFVAGGRTTDLDGPLPTNTCGGQLSFGRLHGFGLFVEAVRQLRGEGADRQVPGAEVACVGVGGGTLAGAVLLTRR